MTGSRGRVDASVVALTVAAVVVTVLAAATLHRRPLPPPTEAVLASQPSPEPLVSLWVGDGYTAGTGAGPDAAPASCLAADQLGWVCNLDALGGTGFMAGGKKTDPSFTRLGKRLAATAAEYTADVVVIDAGRNDAAVSAPRLREAARSYLAQVHQTYPEAMIVAIAPYRLSTAVRPAGAGFAAFEKRLVARYDGVFLDPVGEGWVGGRTMGLVAGDGVHPSQAGHRYLAAHLVSALRKADLPTA